MGRNLSKIMTCSSTRHEINGIQPDCYRYTHPTGRGGFASIHHGQQFRDAAYKEAGLEKPSPWALGGAPRTITLLSAVVGEMVSPHITIPVFVCPDTDDNLGRFGDRQFCCMLHSKVTLSPTHCQTQRKYLGVLFSAALLLF